MGVCTCVYMCVRVYSVNDLVTLVSCSRPYVRKKAILAMYKIFPRCVCVCAGPSLRVRAWVVRV